MTFRASLLSLIAPCFVAVSGCAPVGGELAPSADESTAVNRTAWFVLRADTRTCAAPACGGYYVTEVNRATTICANGSRERQCYVPTIDFTATGLPAALVASTRAAIGTDASQPTVVFLGHVNAPAPGTTYGSFSVQQAWQAPAPVALSGDLVNVSIHGSTCSFIPCSDVKVVSLNDTAVTTLTGLDVTAAPGDALAHDAALAASTTNQGVIANGAVVEVPGNPATTTIPAFRATQFFTLVARTPGRSCTATLQPIFNTAVIDMLYTSESDAPYTFYSRAGAGYSADTAAAFLTLLGLPSDTAVTTQSLDEFFSFDQDDPSLALDELAANARARQLERLIQSQLSDIHVYRVGTIDLNVYIVGRDHCGNLVGYETQSVET